MAAISECGDRLLYVCTTAVATSETRGSSSTVVHMPKAMKNTFIFESEERTLAIII